MPVTVTEKSSAGVARTSSYSDTAWYAIATSWYPSGSSEPTLRKTLILPGARACTIRSTSPAAMLPT